MVHSQVYLTPSFFFYYLLFVWYLGDTYINENVARYLDSEF